MFEHSLSAAYRAVRNAGARAGIPWIVGLRALRHTCASILFRRGYNAKQVQVWLGHHSPAFTLATYVHLLPEDVPEPTFFDELEPVKGGNHVIRGAPEEVGDATMAEGARNGLMEREGSTARKE